MGKIVLVTGGARSGKSAFAERYAMKHGQKIAYIATAQITDDEMQERINKHRLRRPTDWPTFEAQENAHIALREAGGYGDLILFDCVTIYVSNILLSAYGKCDDLYAPIKEQIGQLVIAAEENCGTTVFVTNEVGAGIVPENKLARDFRDLAGYANQMIAAVATEVYLVTCGIAVDIKKLAE